MNYKSKKIIPSEIYKRFSLHRVYFRVPDMNRRKKEKAGYKKGYEVRIPVTTYSELRELRKVLSLLGFSPAKPYKKNLQYVQPLYGKEQMNKFIKIFKISYS